MKLSLIPPSILSSVNLSFGEITLAALITQNVVDLAIFRVGFAGKVSLALSVILVQNQNGRASTRIWDQTASPNSQKSTRGDVS